MASTYAPADAVALCQSFIHGVPVTAVQANCCDMVNSLIWNYYPWGWSVASLTPITCSDGVQDYTPTNTNILRPLKMRIVRTDVTPNEFRELAALANLSPELSRKAGIDTMKAYGWFPSQSFFRFDVAVSVGTGQTIQLQGEYQKTPTKITDANLTTPFAFDDRYYDVFVEGLKWKLYQLTDDQRAGGLSAVKNGGFTKQYTGQYANFMYALNEMARTEDLSSGDEFMWPENPMGAGRSYFPGLYGAG